MDQKSNVSSDFFFHFTNKIEYIVDMVLNGFKPFYCPEMLEYFSKDELNTIQLAYPVICFCDIPLKLQKKHKKRFGGYGIGLKKKWGLDNYLTPVIYSHKNAVTSGVLKNFIDIYNIINDDTKKNGLSEEDFKIFKNCMSLLIMSIKPYEGHSYIKEVKKFSIEPTRFYDEREWRYVPLNVNGTNLSLEMEDYDNKQILMAENEKIQKDNILHFNLDDIEYIFLKQKSEQEPFLNNLRKRYLESEIEVIRTKIKIG